MPTIPKSIILDAKQIDIIQKLIRLANNNPNDNEANVAARRACKMLDGYLFPAVKPTAPPASPLDDILRYAREQQAEYAKRKAQNQQYYEQNYNPFTDENPRKWSTGREPPGSKREAKQGPTETTSKPHADGPRSNPFTEYQEYWWNEYQEETAKTYNATVMTEAELEVFLRHSNWDKSAFKRILYCARCNKDVSTGYPGDEYVFICMDCELKTAKKRG